jgi:hypothetical protein
MLKTIRKLRLQLRADLEKSPIEPSLPAEAIAGNNPYEDRKTGSVSEGMFSVFLISSIQTGSSIMEGIP